MGITVKYLCFPLTAIIEIFFLVFRFPPSSPLKPYPKRPPYQKDVIEFPKWDDPPPGTSQENIPVRPLVMVSAVIEAGGLAAGELEKVCEPLGLVQFFVGWGDW